MQSGYGEMHRQYIVDHNCPSSLFSSSAPSDHLPPNNATSSSQDIHHKFRHPLPHPTHPTPHFVQFGHPVPITQQLFHHPQLTHHQHQFQLYHHHQQHQNQHQHQHQHQHQMSLDQESEPDNTNSPAASGPASFLAAMNFKLGLSESSGGGTSRDDDGILQGGGGDDGGSRHHGHLLSWNADVDSNQAHSLKQPFWRPLDIDYINTSDKRPSKDKQQIDINPDLNPNPKHFKKNTEVLMDHEGNYKLFSELEAIYKPGGIPNINDCVNADGGVLINCNNQTGSGSALTGDEHPLLPVSAPEEPTMEDDTISDTSNNEEAMPQNKEAEDINVQKGTASSSSASRRARIKRRQQKELASMASFFETLVKQLMDQEESFGR